MAMVDYREARVRTKGHIIQVVSPQASAPGAADQEVTGLVQDGLTWWIVEPRGDLSAALVYTAGPLKRVEHPLMRLVGEAEVVRVERAHEMRTRAIPTALESQMGRGADAEEEEDIKEQIRLALVWVEGCKEGDQRRWIVPLGTEEGARQ